MADRPGLMWYNGFMVDKKEEKNKKQEKRSRRDLIKAVGFTVGLILGLALIVVGIVRVATADASQIGGRSRKVLEEEISFLIGETDRIRSERGASDDELLKKEAELANAEAELAKVQQGFYTERSGAVWLENAPLLIAGIFMIGVAIVVYRYA